MAMQYLTRQTPLTLALEPHLWIQLLILKAQFFYAFGVGALG